MIRKRLTREQSKDQTRQRLLNAALVVFTKKGYVAASVEDIAAAAGYTRGAFYSNFRGKPQVLLELLKLDHERMRSELQDILTEGATREPMQANVQAYYSRLFRGNKCFLLWGEAKLLASREAKFRARFNALMHEKREQMALYIRTFSERTGTPLPLPAELLAVGLIGLCDGMQSLHASDPQHVPDELMELVLAGFFARVVFGRDPS
jgi:AcrR family transcriptional regulator